MELSKKNCYFHYHYFCTVVFVLSMVKLIFSSQCYAQIFEDQVRAQIKVYHSDRCNLSILVPVGFQFGRKIDQGELLEDSSGNRIGILSSDIPPGRNIDAYAVIGNFQIMCKKQAKENNGQFRYGYAVPLSPNMVGCVCAYSAVDNEKQMECISLMCVAKKKIFSIVCILTSEFFAKNEELLRFALCSVVDGDGKSFDATAEQQVTLNLIKEKAK